MDIQLILDRLDAVHVSGSGWRARCPAHEDRTPSLSVSVGEDGRALIHCHAGCAIETVLAALELTPADLFADAEAGDGAEAEAVYPYLDEQGTVLYEMVRFQGK